jgi:hypothetical protein
VKQILTFIAILLRLISFAQTGHNGNPVFNSIPMGEDSVGGCKLLANYYPLRNNIDNKTTSVYISDSPDIDQTAKAATQLPADFFILTRNNQVIKLILINNYPEKWILVSTPGESEPKRFRNPLKGDIAENRANELLRGHYDFDLGVADVDEADAIFADFKGRPLNIREKSYIKLGFEKGLEK